MIVGLDLKLLQPIDFHRKFFVSDTRPDGRNLTEFRPFGISLDSISTADGSCLVKLGHTSVICGIKTELVKEKPKENKLSNFISINVDLSPMCSPQFRAGTNEQSQIANQFLIDILNNSKCISITDLFITDTKYCHRLHCDVQCLNHDGNFLDAASIALISALKTVRLPKVQINSTNSDIDEITARKIPLNVLNFPVSTSFIIFDEDIILVDPTSDEESVSSSKLTFTITDGNNISNIYKPGGVRMSDENLNKCISLAKERATNLRKIIIKQIRNIK